MRLVQKLRARGSHLSEYTALFDFDEKEKPIYDFVDSLYSKSADNEQAKALVDELNDLIHDNCWLSHFSQVQIGQGWVDFEREISKIIQTLDGVRLRADRRLKDGENWYSLNQYESDVLNGLASLIAITDVCEIEEVKVVLLNDLNRLIRCLEIYLCEYVDKIQVPYQLHDIADLKIDKVLSFNYTNTYKRLYDPDGQKNVKYNFIHGKANIAHDVNSSNMVLGIDEYLEGDAKDLDNEFIQFKKFFQRIYKGTGNRYTEWIKQASVSYPASTNHLYPELNLYIYGHSLDDTDKDILSALIKAKHAKTMIFYHSQNALGKQIANLVKVIKQEELIARTSSVDRTIRFQKTTDTKKVMRDGA